jgi:hydrogenase nickel incorporation protein HypA/HybF
MHELALAQSIVDLIRDQAQREAFTRVKAVRVSLGALCAVDPRALAFGFEVVARGTLAEGAELVVDRPAGRARCPDCGEVVEVAAHGDPCPRCQSYRWVLTQGEEMRVIDLEVE